MKLIFATNNPHKVQEMRTVLPPLFDVLSLQEAGLDIDVPEPHETLEANAKDKAMAIYHLTNTPCFSEDTGLEVAALGGQPGVRSARYAGEGRSAAENTALLLHNLRGNTDRTARFRTVVCLVLEGEIEFFEGVCEGRILEAPRGEKGFGYDPVFVPEGADHSFAEMSTEEKNRFSHRRKALDKLVNFLNQSGQNQ